MKTFLKNVRPARSIVCLVAMGSAVRDRGHRRSDLDLLIIYGGKRPVMTLPVEVDLRMYAVDKAETQIAQGHEVLGWAMKFGIALYDPQKFWKSLRAKWRRRVPLPSASEAAGRARKSLARAREMVQVGDESATDDLVLGAATQLVRERLIQNGIFPASRPELPGQLEAIFPRDPLSQILDDAMHGDVSPSKLFRRLEKVVSLEVTASRPKARSVNAAARRRTLTVGLIAQT